MNPVEVKYELVKETLREEIINGKYQIVELWHNPVRVWDTKLAYLVCDR